MFGSERNIAGWNSEDVCKDHRGMMDEGMVKKDDPELLAAELTAPAVLQIARADRQPQYKRIHGKH